MSENLIQGVALEDGGVGLIDYNFLANRPFLDGKALAGDLSSILAKKQDSIFYVIQDTSSSHGTWMATNKNIVEYYDGLTIALRVVVSNNYPTTTSLSINNLGAKEIIANGLSKIQPPEGALLVMVYDKGAWYSIACEEDTQSVKYFGAKGDGTTDDTQAFRDAFELVWKSFTLQNGSTEKILYSEYINNTRKQHVVYVPGGTYKLSGTIAIPEGSTLILSQDTILDFTQTSGNCIEMRGSSVLRGNHAVIKVPNNLNGNVISMDTLKDNPDNGSHNRQIVPPYNRADPMWKWQRFIYDVNIIKLNSNGNCRPEEVKKGEKAACYGTAIYMSATNVPKEELYNPDNTDITYMWGITLSGVRIAGGFNYGIKVINYGNVTKETNPTTGEEYWVKDELSDDAWNHDMRIEAFIEGCKTGVYLKNCNNAHLAVTIQPTKTTGIYSQDYVEYGIQLEDCQNTDLSQSCVWDWPYSESASSSDKQHIAMFGHCPGTYLRDHACDNSTRFWQRIYYDNPVSMLTAVVSGRKGIIPIDPKYAFYKNYRSGNEYLNKYNLTGRDYHNMVRYDVPVSLAANPAQPSGQNQLYQIGYFTINGEVENPSYGINFDEQLSTPDALPLETITIEENNYFGITGWSNLFIDGSQIVHYWSPLASVYNNNIPIYFYTTETVVDHKKPDKTEVKGKRYTIYKLITDQNNNPHVYNYKVSITNARRFIFDFKQIGSVNSLDTSIYKRLVPQIQSGPPKIKGQIGIVDGQPVVCTTAATVSSTGQVSGQEFKRLLTEGDMVEIDKITPEQTTFIHGAEGENQQIPKFTNVVDSAVDLDGNPAPYEDGVFCNLYFEEVRGDAYKDFTLTGFIPMTPNTNKIIRIAGEGITIEGIGTGATNTETCRIDFYDSNKQSLKGEKDIVYFDTAFGLSKDWGFVEDEPSTALTWKVTNLVINAYKGAFMRVCVKGKGENLIVTIDEKVEYDEKWIGEPRRLDESIYAQRLIVTNEDDGLQVGQAITVQEVEDGQITKFTTATCMTEETVRALIDEVIGGVVENG